MLEVRTRSEVSDERLWDFASAVCAAVYMSGGVDFFDGELGIELADEVRHGVREEAFDAPGGELREYAGQEPLVVFSEPGAVVGGE